MDDRKKVIDNLQILRTWCDVDSQYGRGLYAGECEKAVGWLDDALELLKAQGPVRRGRWVNDGDGLPVCPFCDKVAMQRLHCNMLHESWQYDIRLEKTPYCPNCGADLREGEKDG